MFMKMKIGFWCSMHQNRCLAFYEIDPRMFKSADLCLINDKRCTLMGANLIKVDLPVDLLGFAAGGEDVSEASLNIDESRCPGSRWWQISGTCTRSSPHGPPASLESLSGCLHFERPAKKTFKIISM